MFFNMGNSTSIYDQRIPVLNSCRYLSSHGLGVIIGVDEKKKLKDSRLGDQYLCLVKKGVYTSTIITISGGVLNPIKNCKIFALKSFCTTSTLSSKTLEYKFDNDVTLLFSKTNDEVNFNVKDLTNNIDFTHKMTIKERKFFENVNRGCSNEFDHIGNFVLTDMNGEYLQISLSEVFYS